MRLVVGTLPGTAAAVTRAAEAAGATRTGHVRALHSVSFEVPAADTARLRARLSARADVTSIGVAHRRWFDDEPADPKFSEQRNYLAAIGLPATWDRGATGSPAVRIAIVDSGVDVRHPDLAGKVVGTHNAVTGGTDVHDVVGHGTGTASVAAAATGNGVGIAGAGRNSSLLAVKVADVTGRIFTDDLAAGIVWAVDHGADVVNLSLGGPTSDRLEKAAVAYAEAHDVLVVAAAGNEGSSAKQYPAALPGVLAVGATSSNGTVRAPFSSYGSWVDLAAPGRSIVVATPGGGYEVADGTSYSAPLVSGAAALLAAYRPGRTAAELQQALIGGADTARIGFTHGLLHVDRALAFLPPGTAPRDLRTRRRRGRRRHHHGVRLEQLRPGCGSAWATWRRPSRSQAVSRAQPSRRTGSPAASRCRPPTAASSTSARPDQRRGDASTTRHPRSLTGAPARRSAATACPRWRPRRRAVVRFTVDGATGGPGVAIDTTAPYAVTLDTGASATDCTPCARYLCSDAVGCDGAGPAEAAVTVVRLHPGIARCARPRSARTATAGGTARR